MTLAFSFRFWEVLGHEQRFALAVPAVPFECPFLLSVLPVGHHTDWQERGVIRLLSTDWFWGLCVMGVYQRDSFFIQDRPQISGELELMSTYGNGTTHCAIVQHPRLTIGVEHASYFVALKR